MVKNHLTHGICQRKFGRVKGALEVVAELLTLWNQWNLILCYYAL